MDKLRFFLALTALSASGGAAAETQIAKVPSRYLVVSPLEAGSKRIKAGDIAFEFPMRWESAAVLPQAVEVSADDRRVVIRSGQALASAQLRFDGPGFANAAAFCIPRTADPAAKKGGWMLTNLVGPKLLRSLTDSQFCLIDRDRDGLADHSVLVNGGSPEARTPRPITPVSYNLAPEAIVSEGDSIKILYRGGKNSFEMLVVQQGTERLYQTFQFSDAKGQHQFSRWLNREKLAGGAYRMGAPGLIFNVRDYDPRTKSILVSWDKTDEPAIVPIPDDVKIRYGYGY
jgi:hypothetical protein